MPAGGSPGELPSARSQEYVAGLRGRALSSAILYLAIVAIWAGVLVPRWLRRSHSASNAAGPAENSPGEASPGQASETLAALGSHAGETATPEYFGSAVEYRAAAVEFAEVHADGSVHEYAAAVEYGASIEYGEHGDVLNDRAAADDGARDAADPDEAPEAELRLRGRPLWSEGPGWHLLPRRRSRRKDRSRRKNQPRQADRPSQTDQPRPSINRKAVLRARRRMLIILVVLTLAAVAVAVRNLAPLWVIAPPLALLGVFALLLRTAARADADFARWRAETEAAHAAREARIAARQRAREALAARRPEPTAEIIDISARVGDQLYDQYADAAVRAVGD